jgi:hypothetical protein
VRYLGVLARSTKARFTEPVKRLDRSPRIAWVTGMPRQARDAVTFATCFVGHALRKEELAEDATEVLNDHN